MVEHGTFNTRVAGSNPAGPIFFFTMESIMTFGELQVGDGFRFPGSDLVWVKQEPFTAYGHIKGQNAATYVKPNGPWHYDRVVDDTIVVSMETDNDDQRSTSEGTETSNSDSTESHNLRQEEATA